MKTIEGYTYKVSEHIGKGYSSTVHKGINDRNGQDVSIKVIETTKLQDPINQMLLQLQVTVLKALAGRPHILHLYDVYATKNNTYLITELCEGDLSDFIKQRKTVPYFESVQILKQLIEGYYDIHTAGFMHRDIKPANIFHKNGLYKYGDFGFAIPICELQQHKYYNVGSPVYMPPQALKDNIYSVSCDIWAIGIIFYQLIKGSVPWRAMSEKVLHQRMINQPIQTLYTGFPQPAKRFLAEVLNLDPRQRPTPEKLRSWPVKLLAANIEIRHLSPYQQRGRNPNTANALRQISKNAPNASNAPASLTFQLNSGVCLQNENKHISPMLKSKTFEAPQSITNEGRYEEGQFKQSYFFATNWINYIKFLHRVLKFVESSAATFDFHSLIQSIIKCMFRQLQNLKETIENQQNQPKLEDWSGFLHSNKAEIIRKKIKKYQNKYRMFHDEPTEANSLEGKLILQAVNSIISHLDTHEFTSKLVVAADYLTTLYQLLHLREKYESAEFMKMSKIDLIMQGNPYNTTPEHLQKLKKKLILIQP